MNIFIPLTCPKQSVFALDDKRVVKMTLETAQMLCTAIHCDELLTSLVNDQDILYRRTHENHPCTVWARTSYDNWIWLAEYFIHICNEFEYRYGKAHLSATKLASTFIAITAFLYNSGHRPERHTPFANCARGVWYDYSELPVHEAYKAALTYKWQHDKRPPTWTKREKPLWAL